MLHISHKTNLASIHTTCWKPAHYNFASIAWVSILQQMQSIFLSISLIQSWLQGIRIPRALFCEGSKQIKRVNFFHGSTNSHSQFSFSEEIRYRLVLTQYYGTHGVPTEQHMRVLGNREWRLEDVFSANRWIMPELCPSSGKTKTILSWKVLWGES